MRYSILLFFTGIFFTGQAQNSPIVQWDSVYREANLQSMEASAMLPDGKIAVIGPGTQADEKILITLMPWGSMINMQAVSIGTETITSLIPAYEGGYLIGANDGLYQIDHSGQLQNSFSEWEIERVNDILRLSDGSLVIVGTIAGRQAIWRISEDARRPVWDKPASLSWEGVSLCEGRDKIIVVTGYDEVGGKVQWNIGGFDWTGTRSRKWTNSDINNFEGKSFFDKNADRQGVQISYDHLQDQYLVLGQVTASQDQKSFFARFKQDGRKLSLLEKPIFMQYPRRDSRLFTWTLTPSGRILFGGMSMVRGAERAWLATLDENGDFEQELLSAYDINHRIQELHIKPNGEIYALGTVGNNAWMAKLAGDRPGADRTNRPDITIDSIAWVEMGSRYDTLEPGEPSYIRLEVTNRGQVGASLRLKVIPEHMPQQTFTAYQQEFPVLSAGQSRVLTIPLIGQPDLTRGNIDLILRLENLAGYPLTPKPKPFKKFAVAAPVPILSIVDSLLISVEDQGDLDRDKVILVQARVANVGKRPATEIRGSLRLPPNVVHLDGADIVLPDLAPGEETLLTFRVRVRSYYEFRKVPMWCYVNGSGLLNQTRISTTDFAYGAFYLPNFYEVSFSGGEKFLPDWAQNSEGWSVPGAGSNEPDLELMIETPARNDLERFGFPVPVDRVPVKLLIRSRRKLEDGDFANIITRIQKSDVDDSYNECFPQIIDRSDAGLSATDSNGMYEYFYINVLGLDDNNSRNHFAVRFLGLDTTLRFNYTPTAQYLSVYSFGINTSFDRYNSRTRGAQELVNWFQNAYDQKGKAFYEDINLHGGPIVQPEMTTRKALFETLGNIKHEYKNARSKFLASRGKSDFQMNVLLYINAHGDPGDFNNLYTYNLWSSARESGENKGEAIYFHEIISGLAEVPINVFIFLETCHSGMGKEVVKQYQDTLAKKGSTIYLITASMADQSAHWPEGQNPLLVAAFLQAVNDFQSVDTDGDDLIKIDELYKAIAWQMAQSVDRINSSSEASEPIHQEPLIGRGGKMPYLGDIIFAGEHPSSHRNCVNSKRH